MEGPKPTARTRLTPAGVVFLVVLLLIQLAAFNTGSNLHYLLAASVLSFLLISVLFAFLNTRRLAASREAPDTVHRSEPFRVSTAVSNRRAVFPGLALRIDPATNNGGGAFAFRVRAGETVTAHGVEQLGRRGAHRLAPLRISSRFPLGLVQRSLTVDDQREVIVYPQIHLLRPERLERLAGSGETPQRRRGDATEFFSLRDYVPGDDTRLIAWRVSARYRRYIVRELEPATTHRLVIVFDTRGRFDTPDRIEDFEDSVDLAASLAHYFLDRVFAVALALPDQAIPPDTGVKQERRILDRLARVEPIAPESADDDWFIPTGDMDRCARLYVAANPDQWGAPTNYRGGRVVDPREVVRA